MKLLRVLLVCALLVLSLAEDAPASESETVEEEPGVSGLTAEQKEHVTKNAEKFEFKAEVTRLMDIIINSLYRDREIFLRELISNSADASDKIRFEGLTDKSRLGEGDIANLDIRISFDKDAKTITLTDKGIGMTKEGLIKNLGIVAHSGTTEFLDRLSAGQDTLSLIGQFGVGFYSVYLVSDKVTVVSKHNDDDQHIWESKADRTFTVVKDPRGNTLGRGTSIILHLKEDATEFLHEETLKRIVTRYSEFIQFPIYLLTTKEVDKEVIDEEATAAAAAEREKEKAEKADEEKKDGEDLEVSEEEEKKDEGPKMKKIKEKVSEWVQLNSVKAIWTRNPKDITDEEYDNFYKSLTKDDKGALRHSHFKAEGELAFQSILYVPKKAPEGYYDKFYEKSNSLKLYVRKVLISDEFEDFMPRYLSFVKGVVDSDDLPLNVNRETLAQNRLLKVMGKKLTRKALEMIKKMSEDQERALESKDEKKDEEETLSDEEKESKKKEEEQRKEEETLYDNFWTNFGKSIKLGVIDDRANKVALSKLLRFKTTKGDSWRGLLQYVADMPEKQNYIYYITGENLDVVKTSPFLEKMEKKGFEVVFMTDPLDEYLVQQLSEFEGKKLMSLSKEGLKLGEDKKKIEKLEEEYKDFISWLKGVYGDKVEKVAISNRLAKSPCVLVTGQYGWTANMERIMKAQTFSDNAQHQWMLPKKTMEINPRHPLIQELRKKSSEDPEDKSIVEIANLLYDSALISSGFHMDNPTDFAARINRVMSIGLKIDPNAPVEDEPEEEATETESDSSSSEESADDNPPNPEEMMENLMKDMNKEEKEGHDEL